MGPGDSIPRNIILADDLIVINAMWLTMLEILNFDMLTMLTEPSSNLLLLGLFE